MLAANIATFGEPAAYKFGLRIARPSSLSRRKAGIHFCPWAPAFAGEAVLSEVLHRRVNRLNDSEH